MCFCLPSNFPSFHPNQSVSLSPDRGWREGGPVREAEGRRRAHQHKRVGPVRQQAGGAHPHQGVVPDTEAHSQEVNTQSPLTRTRGVRTYFHKLQSECLSVFQERICVCRPFFSPTLGVDSPTRGRKVKGETLRNPPGLTCEHTSGQRFTDRECLTGSDL